MVRRRGRPPRVSAQREAAAQAMHDLVGGPRKGRSKPGLPSGRTIKKWCVEFEQLRSSADFEQMKPQHLVAAYILAHEWIYGVRPAEVVGKVARGAVSACKKMLRAEFDDDPVEMVRYLRHIFKKEKETEKWRRENGAQGSRLTYRDMFLWRRRLDDYRVDMAREGG